MKAFSELLKINSVLISVSLSQCGINDDGCQYIEEGIISNSTLRFLDLSKNQIGQKGIARLCDAILGNFSLLQVEWQENPFTQQPNAEEFASRITDFIERNNYHQHNFLMKDLGCLARDSMLLDPIY